MILYLVSVIIRLLKLTRKEGMPGRFLTIWTYQGEVCPILIANKAIMNYNA